MSSYSLLPASFSNIGCFLLGTVVVLYFIRLRLLPNPIPNIPHNKAAANSIWGDAPEMMADMSATGEMMEWLLSQHNRHNSSVVQIFARPFSKPWVMINDFQESQDILMRRTKEFDRSAFFGDVFVGLNPNHHISKSSQDPHFKRNRALLKDLMTPVFLHDVAAPAIYSTFSMLTHLWTKKMEIGQGHPFAADEDIYRAALDAIFAATFPFDAKSGNTAVQLSYLKDHTPTIPSDNKTPVTFDVAKADGRFAAIVDLTESLEWSIKAPLPRLAHTVIRQFPWYKRANQTKETFINEEIKSAISRFEGHEEEYKQTCAIDQILHRELNFAEKEGRVPNYDSRWIKDELFGFLIGGHDTTSTNLAWTVKFLSDNQRVQKKLRAHLREKLTMAYGEKRNPTADEIANTHMPYLDATIEENMRLAKGIAFVARTAMEDAVVLGHLIPKGTDLFMMCNGPDFIKPTLTCPPISDSLRSETSLAAKGRKVGEWDQGNITEFFPERWLVQENDEEVYDAMAGPLLSFGLGPRGCFGRRMAYLEMRLCITLVLWKFELGECAPELSGYKGEDKLMHKPTKCFLQLSKVDL